MVPYKIITFVHIAMGVTFIGVLNRPLAVSYSEGSGLRGFYDEKSFGHGKGATRPFSSKPLFLRTLRGKNDCKR